MLSIMSVCLSVQGNIQSYANNNNPRKLIVNSNQVGYIVASLESLLCRRQLIAGGGGGSRWGGVTEGGR